MTDIEEIAILALQEIAEYPGPNYEMVAWIACTALNDIKREQALKP